MNRISSPLANLYGLHARRSKTPLAEYTAELHRIVRQAKVNLWWADWCLLHVEPRGVDWQVIHEGQRDAERVRAANWCLWRALPDEEQAERCGGK